jgi:hypothetical protein
MTGAAFFEIGIIFAGCQATGMNVGYRASILGNPMSVSAALLTANWKI